MSVPPISRANAARALLEHGGKAPWWFDLWGGGEEYTAGGGVQKAVILTGNAVTLRPGAAIYRRDLRRVTDAVAFTFSAPGASAGRVISFELLIDTGATVPAVTFPDSVTWEDFLGPYYWPSERTISFYFRSTDGGHTWTGARGNVTRFTTVRRGGCLQYARQVNAGAVALYEDTAIYKLDASAGGPLTVSITDNAIGGAGLNSREFELHVKTGNTAPVITWPQNVTFEDFGGPYYWPKDKTIVFFFRTTDGGANWTAGRGNVYKGA